MHPVIHRILALALLLSCLASVVCARAEAPDDFCGIWAADGITMEIWREGREMQCRAVLMDDSGEVDVWAFTSCMYDDDDAILYGMGVTRTRERFDGLWGSLEELSWSMNDLSFAALTLSEDILTFDDEHLDAPVVLTRMNLDDAGARGEALAFLGLWTGESAALRVEDHGVCYLFTVTVPFDEKTDHRWTYTCLYSPNDKRMTSASVSPLRIITHEADGGTTEVEEDHQEGQAAFAFAEDGRLLWTRAAGGETVAFERNAD